MAAMQVVIPIRRIELTGDLDVPGRPLGLVLFAHGSGSSRYSPRNQYVARVLREAGIGTLLFDLLTPAEEEAEALSRHLRFDIALLAERLEGATRWAIDQATRSDVNVGYFGSSTGAAAALIAASRFGDVVGAVVSRGGRPDLAGDALARVRGATLLIVGGEDKPVIGLNEEAYERLHCEKALRIIPGATHLFEEPGALEIVAKMAAEWFANHLQPMAERSR